MALTIQEVKLLGIPVQTEMKEAKVHIAYGEHATAKIIVAVQEGFSFSQWVRVQDDVPFSLVEVKEGKEIPWFIGILDEYSLSEQTGEYILTIELISLSVLWDDQENHRSFQDIQMTYQDVVNRIVAERGDFSARYYAGEEKIGQPIFQSKETDWEFLNRLFARLSQGVIPEVRFPNRIISCGMVKQTKSIEIAPEQLPQSKFWSGDYYKMGGRDTKQQPNDFFVYIWETDLHYQIGDSLILEGQSYTIAKKEAIFERAAWKFRYELRSKVLRRPYANRKLQGIKYSGTVLKRENESVYLHLHIDQTQDLATAYPFPYRPIMGNMVYTMPEVGETVYLSMDSEKDHDARVIHSIRCRRPLATQVHNPNNRYYHTNHIKQVQLRPKDLNFYAASYMEKPESIPEPLAVEMSDERGIALQSPYLMEMKSGKDILIEGEHILIEGKKQVTLAKAGVIPTMLNLSEKFDAVGGKVVLLGEEKKDFLQMIKSSTNNPNGVPSTGNGGNDSPDDNVLSKEFEQQEEEFKDQYSEGSDKINSKLIRQYVKELKEHTGMKLTKSQKNKLAEALRNNEYTKLSPAEAIEHRTEFNKRKNNIIKDWEINTGKKWPTYTEDVINEKGKVTRKAGDRYDAHHIIENSYGGEHEWWNIHPAEFPKKHQGGIHGSGSAANELFK
ncbi:hypothetical protein FACS189418_5670 [Clostridia bacterium]|nr:hypothetical protein FACS189418_5670 [Clostridia bacterium]